MMPDGYFSTPLSFLLDIVLSFYITIIALRIVMQWAKWEYHNPVAQFIIKATQAPVKLLRKVIPPVGRWDSATIVFLLIATAIKLFLLGALQSTLFPPATFLIWILFDLFLLFINLFTISIFIEVLLSWITPHNTYNPITPLVKRMNAPLLAPIRRNLPLMAGIDFSPFVAMVLLQMLPLFVRPLLAGF